MKQFFLFLFILPFLGFTNLHKFYVSVTQIDYVSEKQSVQIISRVFIDDFEEALREKYDETITLMEPNEGEDIEKYMAQYFEEKMNVKINGNVRPIKFLGKEYDVDVVKCYLEIEGVKNIKSFEISNNILIELFSDQQNIVKTKINSKQKSFILGSNSEKMLLKFN